MKRIIFILIAVVLIFCLVGCEKHKPVTKTDNHDILIWTDEETGVQYIIYEDVHSGGITPRLNADGTLYITEESEDTE